MSNTILFVFEGEISERQIFENLKKCFFSEKQIPVIKSTFCGEIFQLWNHIKDDADLEYC